MEHDPGEFKSSENPKGVGPYFGVTKDDGMDPSHKLYVRWCDKQTLQIEQIASWVCPPVNEKAALRVKDPVTGNGALLWICEYSPRGVKVWIQGIEKSIPRSKRSIPDGNLATLLPFIIIFIYLYLSFV